MRELGPHPDDQAVINLYDGRYGPYVKHGTVSASIPRGQDPATVTLAQAVELIAVRAAMGGGKKRRGAAKSPGRAGRSASKSVEETRSDSPPAEERKKPAKRARKKSKKVEA
jgi:DNA topoisomerase-1